MLLVSAKTPWLTIPLGLPFWIVNCDSPTLAAAFETETTVALPPPSTMVVLAPEPIMFKLMAIVMVSWYVAGATIMESPEAASETACPMVLQAVLGDRQLLLSLPLTPSTYHVALATAHGGKATSRLVGEHPFPGGGYDNWEDCSAGLLRQQLLNHENLSHVVDKNEGQY